MPPSPTIESIRSDEAPATVLELVSRITRLMGSSLSPTIQNAAAHEIRHQQLNANKARSMLHWRPIFTPDQGLERTIEWYRAFFEVSEEQPGVN